jgi:hypothetical protein
MHSTRRDFAYVTYSGVDQDGYLEVQAASYGDKGGAAFGLNHTYGFASRPHDPDVPDGNDGPPRWCTLMVEKDGSSRIGWLGYDPRFIQDLAVLSKGGSAQYAGWRDGSDWRVSFAIISGDDGTLQFYRPTGDAAISITAGVDGDGEPIVELAHSDGSIVSMFGGSSKITQMGGLSTPGGVSLVKNTEFQAFATSILSLLAQAIATMDGATPGTGPGSALAQAALLALKAAGTTATKGT